LVSVSAEMGTRKRGLTAELTLQSVILTRPLDLALIWNTPQEEGILI
jgi:hypothetical protein